MRYLSIGLACWVIGSLALFASQKAQLVGQLEGGLFANAVLLSAACWAAVFPSQILCCSVIRIRDAMLTRDSPLGREIPIGKVPWLSASVVEALVLVALLAGFAGRWAAAVTAALRDLLVYFSAFFFLLSLSMVFLYRWFFNEGKRCDSVRVLVAWPSLLVYGMNLMGGCACQVYIRGGSPETVVPYMVVYALFTAAYLLFDLLLSTKRGFVRQEGTRVSLPGPYALIPVAVFLVCSYLGRPECLFALLGCIYYSTFEALSAIEVRRDCGFPRSDDVIRRCEAIAGIARVLLLPASLVIVSFSFGRYEVGGVADEVIAVDAVKAYEIVVISSLVVLSGYASYARLKRLFDGDERGEGDELPAPLEAFYKLLSRLMHRLWHPLSIVVPE